MIDQFKQSKYNSRKFISMWALVLLFTALLIEKHITGEVYSTLILATVGGYMAANVGEHYAKRNI